MEKENREERGEGDPWLRNCEQVDNETFVNKERGLLASGYGDCVVYTVHSLIASNLKNPSQYVAFGTVNFT